MNRHLEKSRLKECSTQASTFLVTHCVACNYESKSDFDVCPRCRAGGKAVVVVKHM